jgi:Kef-type K+ transport system membrane component KefB
MLGMLVSGLILRNAAPELVATLPSSWSKGLRTFALGMIFLRSGLELDLRIFKRVGPAATRLLLVPGLTEAFVTGAISTKLLGLPLFYGARASRSAFRSEYCCAARCRACFFLLASPRLAAAQRPHHAPASRAAPL